MRFRVELATGLLLTFALVSAADDLAGDRYDNWHQWRGPDATGVGVRATPPLEWSETTNVRWKIPIPGIGSSTPIVWEDRVYVLTAVRTDRIDKDASPRQSYQIPPPPEHVHRFVLMCIDRSTGEVKWEKTAVEAVPHEGHHKTHSFAASSPITNGRAIYASFGSRGIFAWDMQGKLLWERDLGDMQTRKGWGEGASPALHGETLVVNWDHEADSFVTALDAASGETRWKVDRDEPTSWSTPLITGHDDRTQVVISATNRIRSYDLASGEVIWSCGGLSVNTIPSPVTANGVVYCMSNYGAAAALAIRLGSSGDLTESEGYLWRHGGNTPYCPSPLLYDESLYFTARNGAVLTILDVGTGRPQCDPLRLPGLRSIYGSPVAASGHVFITGRDGTTCVLKHGTAPEVVRTNRLDDQVDASPAVAGRQMFIRSHHYLYCLEQAQK